MGSEGLGASPVSSRAGVPFSGGIGGALLAALVLVAIAGVVIWLGVTGRLADLRHANFPFHPYPPTGYAYNPFNPGNPDDLINLAEASRVRADLLADGKVESDALARGDASPLAEVSTGGALASFRRLIDANNSQGVLEKTSESLRSLVVGKLADPNDPSIKWCVQEEGTGTLMFVRQSDGTVVRTQSVHFRSRDWLFRSSSGRYLIADSLVTLL